jgi:hypothetical protein
LRLTGSLKASSNFREARFPARSGLRPQALGPFSFGLLLLLRAPFYLPEAEPGQDENEEGQGCLCAGRLD